MEWIQPVRQNGGNIEVGWNNNRHQPVSPVGEEERRVGRPSEQMDFGYKRGFAQDPTAGKLILAPQISPTLPASLSS